MRRAFTSVLVLALLVAPAGASALPGAHISDAPQNIAKAATYPGLQHLHFKFGPIAIAPGQNNIDAQVTQIKPQVPGYITRFKPNLIYADNGQVPPVDVIHLHHGVWLINGYPTFAAGEEKTIFDFPQGYGLHSNPSDTWVMNYMIHNLTPVPTKVYITYDVDYVPEGEPAAATITPLEARWLDVAGIKAYPVFDVHKSDGKHGKFTFPDQAKGAQKADIGRAHEWIVPRDLTLVTTGGHLHPGGLYDTMTVTRGGVTKTIFKSEAKYWEPAGAVSWDVATTVPKPTWRIALKAGDRIDVHSTYDTRIASWYESMGIMDTFYAEGTQPGAIDPFQQQPDIHGLLTHGHLPENNNHGGDPARELPDVLRLLKGTNTTRIAIKHFMYGAGDFQLSGRGAKIPTVRRGHSITFTNLDATRTTRVTDAAFHTITACKYPCAASTGVAYPLANAAIEFDSGELGYGPSVLGKKFTPAADRNTWKTPRNLPVGVYTYFCRIHPFMRGSFRVVK